MTGYGVRILLMDDRVKKKEELFIVRRLSVI